MTISSNLYTVGSAAVTIAAPDEMAQRVTVTNLQPSQNVGGQGATCFLQLGFSEQYNGGHDVHLNNTAGSAFVLRGGERWDGVLYPTQLLSAVSTGQECRIGVLRQEQ